MAHAITSLVAKVRTPEAAYEAHENRIELKKYSDLSFRSAHLRVCAKVFSFNRRSKNRLDAISDLRVIGKFKYNNLNGSSCDGKFHDICMFRDSMVISESSISEFF